MKRLTILSFILLCVLAVTSCEEPVVEIKVSSVTLNSESLSMTEGESFKLNATVAPDNATDKTVIWSTSDAGIANVEDGMVTAVKPGTATITAASKDGGAKVTCPVTVAAREVPVESITLSQSEATLTKGETVTLKATVKPENTTETVVWTTNNASVATVKDGVVTAVGIGAASITATAGGKNASCTVTVKESYIAVTSISLNQTSISVLEGQSFTLKATVKPDDASDKTVTWSSSDESIATVYGGKVTGVKAGTATVTATAGDKSVNCQVQVTPYIAVESVTLDYTELSLPLGASETLTATVLPDNATDRSIQWTSSDSRIVSVRNGHISAVAVGTAVITAKAGEKSASCTVTVEPIEVESITLSKTRLALNPDEYETLTVTFNPANATDKTVTWESSDISIATVSEDGTVRGISKGTATITAKAGKATATCEVQVNDDYFTITNLTNYDGIVTIKPSGVTSPSITLEYSIDKGETWVMLANFRTAQEIPLPANRTVLLSGNNQTFCSNTTNRGWWTISANVTHNVSGDLMSISGDEKELNSPYEFYKLFSGNTKLKNASSLHLTAEKLSNYCYANMFEGCTSLEKAPDLPAATLASGCCKAMFEGCKTLEKAPELNATTLAGYCYDSMFKNCTSLTAAPELPATKMAQYCYQSMFYGCTALRTAPALPATQLANCCYINMFYGCAALAEAPALPAMVMASSCYNSMFVNCTSLKEAPALPSKLLAEGCYMSMFNGCASLEKAPELPAATLKTKCYYAMFSSCFALTEAPVLSAKKLVSDCYTNMFFYCTNLNAITCLATDISTSGSTSNWTQGVALNGTFTKAAEMEDWESGQNGIPVTWTVVDYEEETEE